MLRTARLAEFSQRDVLWKERRLLVRRSQTMACRKSETGLRPYSALRRYGTPEEAARISVWLARIRSSPEKSLPRTAASEAFRRGVGVVACRR